MIYAAITVNTGDSEHELYMGHSIKVGYTKCDMGSTFKTFYCNLIHFFKCYINMSNFQNGKQSSLIFADVNATIQV